jgi:hypothetical protein
MNVDHLLRQTCVVYTAGAQDRFGKNEYGTGVSYACRFQSTSRIIKDQKGEKTPIVAVFTLAASAVVSINDKVVFNGESYRVMMFDPAIDGRGITRHYKMSVSRWNS